MFRLLYSSSLKGRCQIKRNITFRFPGDHYLYIEMFKLNKWAASTYFPYFIRQHLPVLLSQFKTYSTSSIRYSCHVTSPVKRKENDKSRLM